jgi:hypothetical protein
MADGPATEIFFDFFSSQMRSIPQGLACKIYSASGRPEVIEAPE